MYNTSSIIIQTRDESSIKIDASTHPYYDDPDCHQAAIEMQSVPDGMNYLKVTLQV